MSCYYGIAVIEDFKFTGFPGEIPSEMVQTTALYRGHECGEENKMEDLAIFFSIENDSTTLQAKTYDVQFKLTTGFVSSMTCTPAIKADRWYSILDHQCVNAKGDDPFAAMRAEIGTVSPIQTIFNQDSAQIEIEAQVLVLPRVSEAGCVERPTVVPTTEAPTEKPTEKPTEAPTTEAPTEKPTEKPTEAPTPAPTTAPTTAPTPAPTEAPTEKPADNNTALYWILGSCAVVLIIVLFVCCFSKDKKEAKDDKKPLV